MSTVSARRPPGRSPARVLIVGGGVAGLETLLALRALAGDRVAVTILAPEVKFVNRAMSVEQPFTPQRVRGVGLERAAADLGAHWHQGTLGRVLAQEHVAITSDGERLPYDRLVLALGAVAQDQWDAEDVLSYRGGSDGPSYRLLLQRLREGRFTRVAFVKPGGASWPLPLYDLALLTAADCKVHDRTDVQLTLITPEDEPLEIFGRAASTAVRDLLRANHVRLITGSYAAPGFPPSGARDRPGWLNISPRRRGMQVDRIVTQPRLVGPRVAGIPCDGDGFLHTDDHGRVTGVEDVFAAGDATSFPIKQGGLAAQQADAVAETIAASVGADVDPQPFRPILRGVLLSGGPARYLRADVSGSAGESSTITEEALWWPPTKLCGSYLSPYLSSLTGAAADVMPHDPHAIPVETPLDPGTLPTLLDIADHDPRPA